MYYLFLIVLFSSCVISDDCVTYDFEDDFEELFTSNRGICTGMALWSLGSYLSAIESPNSKSSSFISPSTTLSCTYSFTFSMTGGGVIEVNVYMKAASISDQLTILVNHANNGNHPTIGTYNIMASDPAFENGWHIARIQLTGSGVYRGYIALMGSASVNSFLRVDSFRYIPSSQNEDICIIYREDEIVSTTPETIQTVTETDADSEEVTEAETGTTITTVGTTESTQTGTETETEKETTVTTAGTTESTQTETEKETTITTVGTTESTQTETEVETTITTVGTTESTQAGTETETEKETTVTTAGTTESTQIEAEVTSSLQTLPTTTEEPIIDDWEYTFWNPFTITMVVLISLIFLAVIFLIFFVIGKRKTKTKDTNMTVIKTDDIPVPYLLPRVKGTNSEITKVNSKLAV